MPPTRTGPPHIYEPDKLIKYGIIASFKEMALALYKARSLIWRLFQREFSSRHRQSVLGVFWAVLNPVVTIGIFLFLNRSGVFSVGRLPVPYPVFAMAGLSFYGVFASGLSAGAGSLVNAGPMVVKVNFPKISLVFAAMGQALVEFFIRLGLLIVLFAFYGIWPHWGVVFSPVAMVPLVLFTLALALPLSVISGIFRDVMHVLPILTTLLLFLLPVLYPSPEAGVIAVINRFNPLAHLIAGGRDLLIFGTFSNPKGFLWSSLFSFLFFLFTWRVFFLSEPKIAERI
jgi:lipopolysaccharide transport system permease protein